MDLDQNAISTILQAAAKPELITLDINSLSLGKIPAALVPDGFKLSLMPEMEKHLPCPLRKKGNRQLDDAESFIFYAKEHGTPETCRIYLRADFPRGEIEFTATFNDNLNDETGWNDFRATYAPKKSEEWKRWTSQNRAALNQAEFASFLEDNLADIAPPSAEKPKLPNGSQMLALALNFQATSEKSFKSQTRLQSGGVELEYIDREDDATRGKMETFERFELGLAPLFNGSAYRLEARLKYRVRDQKLSVWYELIRPDKVLEAATKDLVELIKNETGFPVLMGQLS